jgi:hypothetical protein
MSMEKEMQIEQERAQRMANMVGRRVWKHLEKL